MVVKELADWFKTKISNGESQYDGEMTDGRKCSFKLRNIGNKTREVVDKIGDSDCIDALKRKAKETEN